MLSKRLRRRVCRSWISHPRVAFGLLVSWIKLAAALLKHWLWNVWAASFSGITARPLVGLFVLLHGLTGFPPKLLDYHASAVFTVLTIGLIWQRYRAWNLSLNALGFGCCSRSVAFDTVSQCAQEEPCCNSRRAVHSWATFCLCQVYPGWCFRQCMCKGREGADGGGLFLPFHSWALVLFCLLTMWMCRSSVPFPVVLTAKGKKASGVSEVLTSCLLFLHGSCCICAGFIYCF